VPAIKISRFFSAHPAFNFSVKGLTTLQSELYRAFLKKKKKIRLFIYQFLQTLVPVNIRELAEALGNAHFNITQFQEIFE